MDWAMILGGRNRYWALYRSSMSMAHFSKNTPLFVASGLLKGSTNINELDGTTQGDNWSVQQMKQLAREIVSSKVRKHTHSRKRLALPSCYSQLLNSFRSVSVGYASMGLCFCSWLHIHWNAVLNVLCVQTFAVQRSFFRIAWC